MPWMFSSAGSRRLGARWRPARVSCVVAQSRGWHATVTDWLTGAGRADERRGRAWGFPKGGSTKTGPWCWALQDVTLTPRGSEGVHADSHRQTKELEAHPAGNEGRGSCGDKTNRLGPE